MLGLALLILAIAAIIPLAALGSLMTRAGCQSPRGPPQWAGTVTSTPAQHHEKAVG